MNKNLQCLLMTCRVSLFYNINIYALSKLPLDDFIIGKRFNNVSVGKMKPLKKTSKVKIDFGNQCSLNLKIKDKTMNFKVFNNGDIIVTGSRSLKDINLFMNKFEKLIATHFVNIPESISECFEKTSGGLVRFIQNHYTLIACVANKFDINLFDDPIVYGVYTNGNITIDDLCYSNNINLDEIPLDTSLMPKIKRLLCLVYAIYFYSSRDIITFIDTNEKLCSILKKVFYSGEQKLENDCSNNQLLPCTFKSQADPEYSQRVIKIENINALMPVDYMIDRNKFIEIANKYYPDNIHYITYEQCMYQGVNVKWKESKFILRSGFTCSLLVFQDHKIIITGCKSVESINAVYKSLKTLLQKYRSDIERKLEYSKEIKQKESFKDTTIIRSKHFIFIPKRLFELNPRNYFYSRYLSEKQ